MERIKKIKILWLVLLISQIPALAQSSASHTIIIRIIRPVLFEAEPLNSAAITSGPESLSQDIAEPRVNMKWSGTKTALHMTASITGDIPAVPATLKMIEPQFCDVENEIELNGSDQCILTTTPREKGSCIFDYSRLTGLAENAMLVYTITES